MAGGVLLASVGGVELAVVSTIGGVLEAVPLSTLGVEEAFVLGVEVEDPETGRVEVPTDEVVFWIGIEPNE